jgi:hypothetical protein
MIELKKIIKTFNGSSLLIKSITFFLIVFISVVGMSNACLANGAEEPETEYRGAINILPLYLIVNGLRMDYDVSINRNHWIQAGPVIFLSESDSYKFLGGDEYFRHTGAGLHLYHRYYPGEGFMKTPVYISYGGMWHYNYLQYNESRGSLEFERYSAINKFGADIIIGYYGVYAGRLMIDFYTGMGIRYSLLESDAEKPSKFDRGYATPGFSGNILIMGLRIGLLTAPVYK